MKRLVINIAAIAAVVLSSCSREALLPEQDGSRLPGELTPLTISTGEMTRTSLSGTVVNWSDDDQIAVFDDLHYNNKFDAVEVDGSSAVFEGLVTARTTDFYAVYPYSDAVKADADAIYVSLPADQTPMSGTFAEEHNISVAHATKTAEDDAVDGVIFKNVCALVQFTVPQRLAAVTEVTFTSNDRTLAGDLVVSKDDMGVTCNSGTNTVKMTGDFAAGSTFYFVVAPGEINGFSATVKTRNGATFRKSSSKSFTAKAGAIKNLGEIDFTEAPTASARHKYENGVLTGTTVTFNLGVPDGMEEYVTKLNAIMYGSDGKKIYATLSKESAPKGVEMVPYTDTPYVPQGEYLIRYLYTLNGVEREGSLTFVVSERPEFTVSATAFTSYSKYRSYCDTNGANTSLLSEANACDAFTMYDIKFSVSISDAVLAQCNMTRCIGRLTRSGQSYLNADSQNTSGNIAHTSVSTFYEMQRYPNLDLGQYTLQAEVKFDGVTVSSSPKTIYVTGLPYRADQMVADDWELSSWNNKFENGYIQLGGVSGSGDCSATSKMQFNVPSTTRVKLNTNVTIRAYKLGLWYNTDFTVKVNGKEIIRQNSDNQDNNNTGKNYNLSGNSTFTSSNNSVEMNSSYKSAGPWCKVHSMEILYY